MKRPKFDAGGSKILDFSEDFSKTLDFSRSLDFSTGVHI